MIYHKGHQVSKKCVTVGKADSKHPDLPLIRIRGHYIFRECGFAIGDKVTIVTSKNKLEITKEVKKK